MTTTPTAPLAPGATVHACVRVAESRHALEQRLAAAEAVCKLVKHQQCDFAPDCGSALCTAIRTWEAFRAQ